MNCYCYSLSMTQQERDRFDSLLQEVLDDLPDGIRSLLDEIPVIVEDRPSDELLRELAAEHGEPIENWTPDSLCGLHTGVAFTERSVEGAAETPGNIMLFREGIVAEAGGWMNENDESPMDADDAVYEEIRVTLLHELGHQFGLDEEDLDRLGYQ